MPTYKTAFLRLFGVLLVLSFSLLASAQFENGSLVGTIRDASGASVAGASVIVTNTATGAESKVTANGDGDWEVPSLRVGVYRVAASMSGFNTAVADNVTLSVGSRQRIDLTLQIGQTTETVEVSNVQLQLETESSQRGQVITGYQSAAFPLVTRNYSDLLGLITGSRATSNGVLVSNSNSLIRQGSFNINGQRSMYNNFLLDGMDNNAYGESNQGFDNQIIAPPPDSIAQFQVVTNNESAEYGRASAATINVATASGTNKFHATAYEFLRNTDLNAAGYYTPTTVGGNGNVIPFQKSTFNRNQFGFNFGGPILKDKLFYFLDYEGFRQTLKPLSVFTLPTQNELNGILVVPVTDPLTGTVYPANTPIPASAINPLSQQVINYFKQVPGLPLAGSAATGLASNDYSKQVPFTDNSDKGDLRLDYQQNANNSWFLRISDRKETGVNYPAFPLPLDGQTNGTIRVLDEQVALGYTHLIGANKIIDARLGLSRTKAGKYSLSIGDNAFNIPGLPTDPTVAGGLPSTGVSGGFTGFGRQSTNPQWQNPSLLNPKVNYSWIVGKHSLKMGYEYQKIWMAVQDANPLYGSYTYSGGFSKTGSSATADNYWADFLFGTTSQYAIATYFVAHLRQAMHFAYVQDDWKVLPNLTLNLGMRWEYGSPYWEQHNNLSNFDPTANGGTGGLVFAKDGGTYDKTLVHPDLNDFGPRIGFAYAATPNTSIRGGFGMSYVHYNRAGSGNILAINPPQALFATVNQKPGQAGYVTADQGFPASLLDGSNYNPLNTNITYVPADSRDSYVESYFLSVQRALAKNIILDVAYVGNHGLKLLDFLNYNQKNPYNNFQRPLANWADITMGLNGFSSNYNGLQVRYEQRFVAGLTLLNSFTWGHSLDNDSASLESNTPSPQDGNNLAAEYAQSDYNQPIINTTSLVYDLPFGRGRKYMDHGGFTNAVLGGWQVSGINQMQAGFPFDIVYNPSSTNQVSPGISATYRGANEYRPNRVPGQKLLMSQLPKTITSTGSQYTQYINLAALSLPATTTASGAPANPFGNLGRNPGRTPAYYDTDVAFNKKFDLPIETMKLEFRSELYNIFNKTNYNTPGTTVSGTLGSAASSGGTITSTFQPRIVQFGLKLTY